MKITREKLKQVILEELEAVTVSEERGEYQPPNPNPRKMNPEEVEKIVDLMTNDPEFQSLKGFVDKFLRYTKSGGDALVSLEAALPEYISGRVIAKLRDKVRPSAPKTPMGMPLDDTEGDYKGSISGGYDFSKRFTNENFENDQQLRDSKEDVLRQIVAQGQRAKVQGDMVDLFSAGAIVTVLDALSPENKNKFLDFPPYKMAEIAFKLLK